MEASTMLDRLLLVALTPLALAGGTATSWLQDRGYVYARLDRISNVREAGPAVSQRSLAIHRGADGLLHTVVRIEGVPVDMIVDTGASRTILSSNDARRIFTTSDGELTSRIMTLGGERELRVRSVGSVEMAGQRYARLDAGLLDSSPVSVIGLDWLALTGPITISTSS